MNTEELSKPLLKLEASELEEFKKRRSILEHTLLSTKMLQESYNSWIKAVLTTKGLEHGRVNIDIISGDIVLSEEMKVG